MENVISCIQCMPVVSEVAFMLVCTEDEHILHEFETFKPTEKKRLHI